MDELTITNNRTCMPIEAPASKATPLSTGPTHVVDVAKLLEQAIRSLPRARYDSLNPLSLELFNDEFRSKLPALFISSITRHGVFTDHFNITVSVGVRCHTDVRGTGIYVLGFDGLLSAVQ